MKASGAFVPLTDTCPLDCLAASVCVACAVDGPVAIRQYVGVSIDKIVDGLEDYACQHSCGAVYSDSRAPELLHVITQKRLPLDSGI